ncbi:MAG: class C sortase [Lachnospiraceae bacterium]|nr:class C sortase [Lachnospiraceae bacterium]
MKRKLNSILIALLFLAGLSLLLYPLISNQWNSYRQSRLISSYTDGVEEKNGKNAIDYDLEWQKAEAYNKNLLPMILPDSFAIAEMSDRDEAYMACLNLNGDGIMGIVEIPKIDVKLPIYHTTDTDVLEIGAGHLEGSSLPIGGESNHAVISAHRGLPSATLFTDLDKLEKGDHFLLHVLDDTLCYEVDQISVVEPEQTEALSVVEGEDLVTLLTCTPYGVNSHRLLVRGHRVPYVPEEVEDEQASSLLGVSMHTNYLFWVIFGIAITACFIFLLYRREKKIQRKHEKK